jgi:hypothetical protein
VFGPPKVQTSSVGQGMQPWRGCRWRPSGFRGLMGHDGTDAQTAGRRGVRGY